MNFKEVDACIQQAFFFGPNPPLPGAATWMTTCPCCAKSPVKVCEVVRPGRKQESPSPATIPGKTIDSTPASGLAGHPGGKTTLVPLQALGLSGITHAGGVEIIENRPGLGLMTLARLAEGPPEGKNAKKQPNQVESNRHSQMLLGSAPGGRACSLDAVPDRTAYRAAARAARW